MVTLKNIRDDLKKIKYYYARKEMFDKAFESTGNNEVINIVSKYNDIIKSATPKLYELYVYLYLQNMTQEDVADKLCYTTEYIQMLNKQLLLFIQTKLIA